MSKTFAISLLIVNFVKEAVISGWTTARLILRRPADLHPGFVRLPYEDLPDGAASLLGALITLTPGTTMVDIDPERREFLLHLLDTERTAATLAAIRRDFMQPLRVLCGSRR
jgi:multisubunit Na+/H+ antiporter MnhE subunit